MNTKSRINLTVTNIIEYLYDRDDFSTFMVNMDEYEFNQFRNHIEHIITRNFENESVNS